MAALLHDAAEAYLGDLPHPIKHRSELGAVFRVAEKQLKAVINERFALPQAAARIKPLDRALLATERRIFSTISWEWPELDGVEPLDLEIDPGSRTAPARSSPAATTASTRLGGVTPTTCDRLAPPSSIHPTQSTRAGSPARAKTTSARRSSSGCWGQRLNASRSSRSVVRTMNAVTS